MSSRPKDYQLREIKGAENWPLESLWFFSDDTIAKWDWMDDWHKDFARTFLGRPTRFEAGK